VREVISNTSPLQYLHQTNLLDLLPMLYGEIVVPQGVAAELEHGRRLGVTLPVLSDLACARVRAVPHLPVLLLAADLGRGEKEALALAAESENSLVILDDGLARRYAQLLGIGLTGTLGVLLKAKEQGHLAAVAPVVEQLEALNFRLDPATRAAVLRMAGEG